MYFSLWLTLVFRFSDKVSFTIFQRHAFLFTAIFFLLIAIFHINELYEFKFVKGTIQLLSRLIVSLIIGGVIATTFFYFGYDRLFTLRPQRVLLIDLVIILILAYFWRVVYLKFLQSKKFTNNVLIIGKNDLTQEITEIIQKSPQLGFAVIENIDTDNGEQLNNLEHIIKEKNIHTLVSLESPRDNEQLMKNLFKCLPLKINFFDASNFYEKLATKVPVTTIQHVWFLENLNETTKSAYELSKRLFDIAISVVVLVVTLPFLPFITLAIKTNSKGPLIFKQTRTGKDGKNFVAMKFRSMSVGAEKNGPQWATKNDPRVTGVGKFIRKTRIDEIPQLLNVLRGEMSFIGPRPERPEFIETLEKEIPFYRERLLVKPGLTGWAQVVGPKYGGSKEETFEKLQYDLFYIKNRSLGLDLSIVLKTIKTVLSGSGQ
jgi:exopolysaccharide biosynthesis polyprenyl glycosylphosphotransferase